jgi:hypothetical protein
MRLLALLSLTLAGCLKEKVPFCDNGAFCPEPLVCTDRETAPFCGTSAEVEPCMGQPDEMACTLPGATKGYCETGLCKVCDENNAACTYDTWVSMQTPVSVDLSAIYVAGPRDLYVAGKAGAFMHWDGRTWTVLPAPSGGGDLKSLAGASGTDIMAGSVSSVFHWDGTTWSGATATQQAVLGMWGAGPDDFFLSGVGGMTGRFTGTWSYLTPTANNLNAIGGTTATNVYAVGASGTVLHWDTAWTAQSTGTSYNLLAVAAEGSRAVAVGRTTTNSPALLELVGSTWTDKTAMLPAIPANVFLRGVWASGTHTFAVGDMGTIVHGDGTTWTAMPSNTTVPFFAVGGSGKDVFAVGNGGKVLRYRLP